MFSLVCCLRLNFRRGQLTGLRPASSLRLSLSAGQSSSSKEAEEGGARPYTRKRKIANS